MERLTSRKFLSWVAVNVGGLVLVLGGQLDAETWMLYATGSGAGYQIANAVGKLGTQET